MFSYSNILIILFKSGRAEQFIQSLKYLLVSEIRIIISMITLHLNIIKYHCHTVKK